MLDLSFPAQLRQFKRAAVEASARLDENPDDAEALRVFGEWYALRQRWDRAIDPLERARAAGAGLPSDLLARCYGRAHDREDWHDKVPAELAKAAAHPNTRSEAAALLLHRKEVEKEVPSSQRRYENSYVCRMFLHPYFELSRLHANKGKREEAMKLARAARAADGNPSARALEDWWMFQSVASSLTDGRHIAEAKQVYLDGAASSAANRSSFLRSAGEIAYVLAEFEESAKYLHEATDERGEDAPPAWYAVLGDALWRTGRREQALAAWRQGIRAAERVSGSHPSIMKSHSDVAAEMKKRIESADRGEKPPVVETIAESQMRPTTRPAN